MLRITKKDCVLFTVGGVIALAAGAFIIYFVKDLPFAVVCAVGGVCVALGILLLLFARHARSNEKRFFRQANKEGSIGIDIKSIETQVRKCVDSHPELTLNGMHINTHKSSISVDLDLSLATNISIPMAVEDLQKQIKQYLNASSGITVDDVRVNSQLNNDVSQDSPFIVSVNSAEDAPCAVEEAAVTPDEEVAAIEEAVETAAEEAVDTAADVTAETVKENAETENVSDENAMNDAESIGEDNDNERA